MIAQTLAANGAKVYITGRRADVIQTSARVHGSPGKLGPLGGSIVPIVMDITSKDSIKSVVAEITQKEGWLNVLVNNAGIFIDRPAAQPHDGPEAFSEAMLAEDGEGNWQRTFNTNCTAQYFVTAAFLPLLAKAATGPVGKVGCVINNTSVSGRLRMSQRCQFSYNVSKGALSHLTRQMAYEFNHANINVRVNDLALGYFPSEMSTGVSNEENESTPVPEKFANNMAAFGATNTKRMGTPQELASAILVLATNDYMWGSVMLVDGGMALQVAGNI
ncbi:NAD(P)-binding protein [Hypoxylon fuscum]|nr:NAD(P)-binding protein [Hypoxylon fuscum]